MFALYKVKSELSICLFSNLSSNLPFWFLFFLSLTKHTMLMIEADGFNFYYALAQMESEIWKGSFHLYSRKLTLNLTLWCLALRYPTKTGLIDGIEMKTTNGRPQSINQSWGLWGQGHFLYCSLWEGGVGKQPPVDLWAGLPCRNRQPEAERIQPLRK